MCRHIKMAMWGHSKKVAICKPKKEASEETNPANTLPWTSRLHKYEKMNFYCLNHTVCGISLWQSLQTRTPAISCRQFGNNQNSRAETGAMPSSFSPSLLATELQRILTCNQSELQNKFPEFFLSESSILQVSSSRMPIIPTVQFLPLGMSTGPEEIF